MAKAKTISMYRIRKAVKPVYGVGEQEARVIALSIKYNQKAA